MAGSFALHLAFLLALLLAMPKPAPPPPEDRSVSVEILDPGQFEAMTGPATPVLPAPLAVLPPTPPEIISFPADLPPPPHSGETIVPQRMLSAAVLADPRSADALAALPQLASDERIVQLCSIEALEQIAALGDYEPDLLAAYSMDEVRLTGRSIDATGAAFRSGGSWFHLAFKCGLTPSLDTVKDFEFRIGEQIPHQQWASHNLAEGEDQDND